MSHEHDPIPADLPEILDPVLLWAANYYDGAITGMISVDGEMLWARMVEECYDGSCGFSRRYEILRLAPEDLARQQECHADFLRYVAKEDAGWGISFHYWPKEQWDLFYSKWLDIPDPTGEVIGWFHR